MLKEKILDTIPKRIIELTIQNDPEFTMALTKGKIEKESNQFLLTTSKMRIPLNILKDNESRIAFEELAKKEEDSWFSLIEKKDDSGNHFIEIIHISEEQREKAEELAYEDAANKYMDFFRIHSTNEFYTRSRLAMQEFNKRTGNHLTLLEYMGIKDPMPEFCPEARPVNKKGKRKNASRK